MRAALALALLAASAVAAPGRFDRTNSRTPQGRSVRGLPYGDSAAFFEFAPASGAGMGAACTPPNLVRYSKDFSTGWTPQGLSATAPTVTANYGLAPDGTMTADRIVTGATVPNATSWLYQSAALAIHAGTVTASIWMKGVSTGGVLSFGSEAQKFGRCTYTTEWTQCTGSGTATSNYFTVGSFLDGASLGAQDVLIWQYQVTVGSTLYADMESGVALGYVSPTGSKGEVLTHTRSSTATCVKGSPTTGIQNGDLVTVAVNQPRVGNPDGSGLKLLMERTAQNVALRSEEFDNATWAVFGTGVAAPTRSANYAVGPFNATTAERIQAPATTTGQDSFVYQTVFPGAQATNSLFVRGTSGSGTLDVCIQAGGYTCTSCAFVADSWSRCEVTRVGTGTQFAFGNLTSVNGGIARGALDALVFGAQCETGTRATSYTPTTSAAITRSADATPWFPWTQSLTAAGSTAVTLYDARPTAAGDSAGMNFTTGTTVALGFIAPYLQSDTVVGVYLSGATNSVTVPSMPGRSTRVATSWTGTSFTTWANGTSQTNTTAAAPSGSIQRLWLGAYSTTNQVGGYIGNVCVDPSPQKCR